MLAATQVGNVKLAHREWARDPNNADGHRQQARRGDCQPGGGAVAEQWRSSGGAVAE